ncbi:DgyrCDS9645 [Dimorphilus gyrociliatus]|uniref:E3 ubiquitin-protein ligase RNF10 n=1 Tax=Dimorphilus gyrociliatus TaxID=2664684 RepID=A0A7I8VXL2_9ANNE|nr:DgyrCDS9645 [Dimorphilus gyrociliatus]
MEKKNQRIPISGTVKSISEKRADAPRQNYGVRRREQTAKPFKNDSKNFNHKKCRDREHGGKLNSHAPKQNLNHLLSFTYEERGRRTSSGDDYHFVLEQPPEENTYLRHVNDPNELVNWKKVIQVRVFNNEREPTICCICLEEMRAARITKCGHGFCLPCILKYRELSLTGHKCPVCMSDFEIEEDMRPLLFKKVSPITIGDTVKFQLMRRSKSNILAVPRDKFEFGRKNLYNFTDAWMNSCAKILIASPNDINSIINNELEELLSIKDDDPKDIEGDHQFVNKAIELSQKRFEKQMEGCDEILEETSNDSEGAVGNDEASFYFYQLQTGELTYLHWLNTRMLIAEYGSLEACPDIIEGQIIEIERFTITEENVRGRLRFYSHLPIGSELMMIEININSVLSPENLSKFESDLQTRMKNRKKKKVLEDKLSRRIEKAEREKYKDYRRGEIVRSDFQKIRIETESIDVFEPAVGTPPGPESPSDCVSFAQMLKSGKAKIPPPILPKSTVVETTLAPDSDEDFVPRFEDTYKDGVSRAIDENMRKLTKQDVEQKGKSKKKGKKLLFSNSMNI